jgi:hypothetical protein
VAVLLVNVKQGDRRYFRIPAIVVALCTAVLFLAVVFMEHHSSDELENAERAVLCCAVPVLFFAHLNILLMVPTRGLFAWLKVGTIACSGGCAGLIFVASAGGFIEETGVIGAITAAGIPALCGSLALVAVALMGRARSERVVDYTSTLTDIQITCPRCEKGQRVPLGDSACAGCGLQLSIKATEPRCAECGYMLYGITSPRCPECGTAVGGVAGAAPAVAPVPAAPAVT